MVFNTKEIRDGIDKGDTTNQNVYDLCDHIDELERKLKIADDALNNINNHVVWSSEKGVYLTYATTIEFARDALKQIRGEDGK